MPPTRFRATSLGVVVCCTALAVAGCGGSSKPTNAGGPRAGLPSGAADPCRLATSAEVAAAVGAPVGSPLRSSVQGTDGTVLTCTWRGTAADPDSVAELNVYPSTAAFDAARKTQSGPAPTASGTAPTSRNTTATGSGFHEISGLGDAAFAGEQGIIWVRKGSSAFTVHWFDPQNPLPATVAKGAALAKVVAARV